jgi:dTDP-4-dehydrorhamnose 3,5-epimerase-like enzyme
MKDSRGEIINVASGEFKAVQLITSKKGTVRSCHYHKKGGHWLYVVEGRMIYSEMAVTSDINPPWDTVKEVRKGEKVWSGPLMIHKTEFPEDTTLISCAITYLDHDSYEADTVRVNI